MIYAHLAAIISWLLLILILGILHWRKTLVFSQQFKGFTLNLLILLLPGMLSQLMALFSRRSLPDLNDKVYTIYELGIEWGSEQFQYSYKIVLPLLIFWLTVLFWAFFIIFRYGNTFYNNNRNTIKL